MKHLLFPVVFLVALSVAGPSGAAFKPEPIDTSLWKGQRGGVMGMAGQRPSPFTKEPEYEGTPLYGRFRTDGASIDFVAFAAGGAGAIDTLILDLNKNKDLTDDKTIKVDSTGEGVPVSVTLSPGRTVKVRITESKMGGQPGIFHIFTMEPAEWLRGHVKLKDKELAAIIIDQNMNGLQCDGDDMLVVDTNGDGKFEMNMASGRFEGITPLQPMVLLAGDCWNLKLNADAPDITLTPYVGDCGKIVLKKRLAGKMAKHPAVCFFVKKDRGFLACLEDEVEVRLPVGSLDMVGCSITQIKDDQPISIIQLKNSNAVTIEKNKTVTLEIVEPKAIGIVAQAQQTKVSVSKSLQGGDMGYLMFMKMKDGKPTQMPEPVVEIYSAEKDGKRLADGKMQYG